MCPGCAVTLMGGEQVQVHLRGGVRPVLRPALRDRLRGPEGPLRVLHEAAIVHHHAPAKFDPARKLIVCSCCGEPVYVDGKTMGVDPSTFRNWEDPKVREEVMRMIKEDEGTEDSHHHD